MENVNELLRKNPVKADGNFDKEIIKEYLANTYTLGMREKLDKYFLNNLSNEELLVTILNILLEKNNKNDEKAKMGAAFYISKFEKDLLIKYKSKIIDAQKNEEDILKPFRNKIPDWLNK